MKVFLGWSGDRSEEVAGALRDWLPNVLQSIKEVFFSEVDIEPGKEWFNTLRDRLAESDFGIMCLTKDNCRKPWLLFESGALAGRLSDKARLCPYLIDMEISYLPSPINQFHACASTESGTLKLIRALNGASDLVRLEEPALRDSFRLWWPELKIPSKPQHLGFPTEVATFLLVHAESNKLLSVPDRSRSDGAPLILKNFPDRPQDLWRFHEFEDYYAIVSAHTAKCLDVEGSSRDDAAKIHQWEFGGGDNQKWTIMTQENGMLKVRAKHSGKFLGVINGKTKQMADGDSLAQKWWIEPYFGS
jgi:hypothetical protein